MISEFGWNRYPELWTFRLRLPHAKQFFFGPSTEAYRLPVTKIFLYPRGDRYCVARPWFKVPLTCSIPVQAARRALSIKSSSPKIWALSVIHQNDTNTESRFRIFLRFKVSAPYHSGGHYFRNRRVQRLAESDFNKFARADRKIGMKHQPLSAEVP